MTPRQAIRILMLSPCYWLLSLAERKQLIHEFCRSFSAAWVPESVLRKKEALP
ncbi:hypothetical protein JWJ90_02215 [Desulfobulbus rhabdoformis]|uniref:hypothetical protein n=1 Tax=Desulfobulbus rhabdoformis TaxID=34032 RepID=UPI0019643543|nr:hypothetical protein [Desulfobulbus rhabdoformis]MBM9613095.1 hypothetical protein [Desulfobulbus rhabdoformis]